MAQAIPDGFVELSANLGFSDVLRPLYQREAGGTLTLGMRVRAEHTNLIGICHGGVLMTLADIAAAWAVNHKRGTFAASPTLNLSFDFITAAREGDWLEARVERVSLKRRFAFSSGVVWRGDDAICRFSGGFYLPDHDGMVMDNPTRKRAQPGATPE